MDPNNPKCSEDSAYPAAPDSEYGWEKLFSFGPEGTWKGGKEKAPAALSRKIAGAADGDEIEIWQ